MKTSEETLEGAGGIKIFFRSWHPDGKARGVVVIPGFNAHSGYYAWAAAQLTGEALAAYVVDLRGRGKILHKKIEHLRQLPRARGSRGRGRRDHRVCRRYTVGIVPPSMTISLP